MKSRHLICVLCLFACQDPRNWDNLECKPPVCVATGTCPEQLVKPEAEKK